MTTFNDTNINRPDDWRNSTDAIDDIDVGDVEPIPYRVIQRSGSYTEDVANAREVLIIQASRLEDFARASFRLDASFPVVAGRGPYSTEKIEFTDNRVMPGTTEFRSIKFNWESLVPDKPVDPFGADPDADTDTYEDLLKVTVDYSTEPDGGNNIEDRAVFSARASGEFLHTTTPGWVSDPNPDSEADSNTSPGDPTLELKERDVPVTIVWPKIEWTIRMTKVPTLIFINHLLPTFRNLLGTVNEYNVPFLFNAPPETILFMGWSYDETRTWRHSDQHKKLATVEMRFLEKRVPLDTSTDPPKIGGHNHFWRPATGKWERLTTPNGPPHKLKPFDGLFGDLIDSLIEPAPF